MQDPVLPTGEPPSSPPTTFLLITRKMTQVIATVQKTATLKPSDPANTKYLWSGNNFD